MTDLTLTDQDINGPDYDSLKYDMNNALMV